MTQETQTGTLEELNVQPGYVVEFVGGETTGFIIGKHYECVTGKDGLGRPAIGPVNEVGGCIPMSYANLTWRLISRATASPSPPPTASQTSTVSRWSGSMTDVRETIAGICERHLPHPSDDEYLDATDAILSAITPPPLEWYINYDHWEATTPHGTYEVGGDGLNSAWVKFPDGSSMWVKPFEMGRRLCDMDNAVSVLGVKEKADE